MVDSGPADFIIFLFIGYSFIFVVGTSGNALLIYKTLKKRRKKSHDYQIVSLAVADLLGSIFYPIVMIHAMITSKWSILGTFGCKLFLSMCIWLTVTSAWMMVSIAISRYRIILRSTKLSVGRDYLSVYLIIQAWIVGLLICSPYMYNLEVQTNDSCTDIWSTKSSQMTWGFMLVVTWFLLPINILVFISLFSYRRLKKIASESSVVSSQQNGNTNRQSARRNERVAKTFAWIIAIFFLLTVPYVIFYVAWIYTFLYDTAQFLRNFATTSLINHFLYFVSSLNSIVNPFVYARADIIKVFKRCRKNRIDGSERTTEVSEITKTTTTTVKVSSTVR